LFGKIEIFTFLPVKNGKMTAFPPVKNGKNNKLLPINNGKSLF